MQQQATDYYEMVVKRTLARRPDRAALGRALGAFSLQRPSEDAKHASHCSHSAPSGAVSTRVREIRRFSHDLNSYQKKGAPNHLPQTPSPRGGLSQREPWLPSLTGKKDPYTSRCDLPPKHLVQIPCAKPREPHKEAWSRGVSSGIPNMVHTITRSQLVVRGARVPKHVIARAYSQQ